ncbi:MAG: hypothetical protein D6736_14350 [Nitrospinota bacterium]|nr:MAG: hypothetical protein D6736_14350 [Nitrospinota bacterium]
MGLIARQVEEAGICTVAMSSALDVSHAVKAPRTVFLNFPQGHQTGKPLDRDLQRRIILDALRALETLTVPGSIVQLPYRWEAGEPQLWEQELSQGGKYLIPEETIRQWCIQLD